MPINNTGYNASYKRTLEKFNAGGEEDHRGQWIQPNFQSVIHI